MGQHKRIKPKRTPYERTEAGELVAQGMAVKGRIGFAMIFVDKATKKVEFKVPFFPDQPEFFEFVKIWSDWFFLGESSHPDDSVRMAHQLPMRSVSAIIDPATGEGYQA